MGFKRGTLQPERASKQKVTGAHFTPPDLAAVVARRLVKEVFPVSGQSFRVLDPSCGDGELLLAIAKHLRLTADVTLVGVEADACALERARQRAAQEGIACDFIQGDFLQMVAGQPHTLFDPQPDEVIVPPDLIIANPPYVRTQLLGATTAQRLAEMFGLSGRVDLYHAFVAAMTRHLAPGGSLGMITSNRFLTTAGGAALRELLAREYSIREIVDLGDTKLFSAAVLPALFFGQKRAGSGTSVSEGNSKVPFVRVYERNGKAHQSPDEFQRADSICDILEAPQTGTFGVGRRVYDVAVGHLRVPSCPKQTWAMTTDAEGEWVASIDARAACRVGDVGKVRVGIKTTADSVFIRDNWHDLPPSIQPEPEVLFPLFSHDDAARWRVGPEAARRKVLYTHHDRNGRRAVIDLACYPRAGAYLESNRTRLAGRSYVQAAGRKWYEIWVPQDPATWRLPKLVFPDISPEPRFFYDVSGSIVDGNCYWITASPGTSEDLLFLVLAVANTRLMTRYHDLAFQNKLYAGRRRYLTQYVEKYPIPDPSTDTARELIELGRTLALAPWNQDLKARCEERIEELTAISFGVPKVG